MKPDKKDKYLKKKYGISLEEYNSKLAEQKDCCAMCGKHKSNFKRSLHVDHCHQTGHVRALVCYYCNHQLIRRHNADTAFKLNQYFQKYQPKK